MKESTGIFRGFLTAIGVSLCTVCVPMTRDTTTTVNLQGRCFSSQKLSALSIPGTSALLSKTVQVFESPKSCRIYALCSFHCSVPPSSEGINGYKLGDGEKREFLFSKYVNFNLFLWLAALFLVPFLFCAIPAEHVVLMQCVSLVVWLFLVGHYDFFQSCVGTCQWVRCLIVTLVHLAPASNFSWTDLDSQNLLYMVSLPEMWTAMFGFPANVYRAP